MAWTVTSVRIISKSSLALWMRVALMRRTPGFAQAPDPVGRGQTETEQFVDPQPDGAPGERVCGPPPVASDRPA
jgi:hypothetical protein